MDVSTWWSLGGSGRACLDHPMMIDGTTPRHGSSLSVLDGEVLGERLEAGALARATVLTGCVAR